MNTKYRRVIKIICDYFYIDQKDFYKNFKSRKRKYVKIRQIVSYFLKEYTALSLQDIGDIFDKDHATAIDSIKKVKNYIDTDKQFKVDIEALDKKINPYFSNKVISVKRRFKIDEIFKLIELSLGGKDLETFKEFYNINEDIYL